LARSLLAKRPGTAWRSVLAVLVASLASTLAGGQARRLEPAVEAWARQLAGSLRPADVPAPPTTPLPGQEVTRELVEASPLGEPTRPSPRPGTRAPGKSSQVDSGAPSAVRLSAGTVLRLANARAMPNAVPVVAEGQRPAGLRLSAVSRLGVGVRDGDVLSHVAGSPVTQVSAVVSMVLAARARRATSVDGTLWRGSQSFPIQVEMPYPVAAVAASVAGPVAPTAVP
jgi:hypothetical protein